MSLRVSDVIGLDRLRALRAEGKDNTAILEEVNTVLDPIKKNIGEEVYHAFSSQGISFAKMKEYSQYQEQKAKEATKKAEEENYAKDVAYAKEQFKKEYSGTDFTERLDRGVGRVLTELDIAGHNLVGAKPDPTSVGFLEADDEIAGAWEKAHRTPQQQKIYEAKEKTFDEAKGTVDTITTGADMLWQKAKNPSEWDMAGLVAELINPINLAGAGAGAVATKALANTALKGGTKVAIGTGAGAVADGTVGYGYDYNVQKGRGRSDEEATKAATLGLATNVAMGAGMGGMTSLLKKRTPKMETDADASPAPNTLDETFKMTDGTIIDKESFSHLDTDVMAKELEQNPIEIPPEIANLALLKIVDESEQHSSMAMDVIKKIDESTIDFGEREAKVAKFVPPTELEVFTNRALNDRPVMPSVYGTRLRDKLALSIENADNISMEQINKKLDAYGIAGEHKAVVLDSFAQRDIGRYNDWAVNKIQQQGKTDANVHARDAREDTSVKKDRASDGDAGAREAGKADTKPQANTQPQSGAREDTEVTRPNTGDVDREDGVSTKSEGLDTDGAIGEDGRAVRGAREDNVVQDEDGVRIDEEVETPAEAYERLKDEPFISGDEKARLRQRSEDFKKSNPTTEAVELVENRKQYLDDVISNDKDVSKKAVPFAKDVIDDEMVKHFGFKTNEITRDVSPSAVKHTLKNHGDVVKEGKRGQVAVTLDDIVQYPEIVSKDYTLRAFGVNNRGNPIVYTAKQINGHYVVIEEVAASKGRLVFNNMWKGKGEVSEAAMMSYVKQNSPRGTSKTMTSNANAQRSIDSESLLVTSKTISGYEPDESMPSPRKASVPKTIAQDDTNVKTRGDLRSHGEVDLESDSFLGKEHTTHRGKGQESVAYLMEKKEGWVKGAFSHPDLGDIDLVWGDGRAGLQHILERRTSQWGEEKAQKFISHLQEIVEDGVATRSLKNPDTVEIVSPLSSGIVSLKYNKNDKNWLISAFRNSKNKKRLKEKSFDPLVVHGESPKVDAPIAHAAKDKAVTTSKNSTKSVAQDDTNVKTRGELISHRYFDDVVAFGEDGRAVRGARKDNVVQDEDGVRIDEEVETPLSRAGEVHEVDSEKFNHFAVDTPTETNIPKFMLDFKEPVMTPIGELKINTDYLLNKAMARDSGLRSNELHLIKPTLTEPAYVVKYREAYNFIKPFVEDGKVKKYLSVISDSKGEVQFVTSHKMKGNSYKKILNEGDVLVDNVGGLLRTGAKSTESRNLKPVTLSKTIAQDDTNVKTREELISHRYFDDVVAFAKAQKEAEVARPKRTTPSDLRVELEKRGLDKSDDAYKAEMSKLFKQSNTTQADDYAFHSYNKTELKKIESGDLDRPLMQKLRDDLREYAANPKYQKNRDEIDGGYRAFADEADILREVEHDERLGLVESETFRDSVDEPVDVDAVAKGVDVDSVAKGVDAVAMSKKEIEAEEKAREALSASAKKEREAYEKTLENIFGGDSIKLSDTQNKILSLYEDPIQRDWWRKTFERETLSVYQQKDKLKAWERENLDKDGNIKKAGEC